MLQRDRHFPRSVRATLELELELVRFDLESFKIYNEASAWVLPCLASAPPPCGQAALQFFGFFVAHVATTQRRLAPGLCGNMSAQTFTHTGYTGTQICADPATRSGLVTVLLTNRVFPAADAESERRIHTARQGFNNAVLAALLR